jgi:hypothetical protein
MKPLMPVIVALVVACGGSSGFSTVPGCTVNIQGDPSASDFGAYGCAELLLGYNSMGDSSTLDLEVIPHGVLSLMTGQIFFQGRPALTSYTVANTSVGTAFAVDESSGGSWSAATNGRTNSEGSFTLTITSLGDSSTNGTVTVWSGIHGTLTLDLVIDRGTPAAPDRVISVTF